MAAGIRGALQKKLDEIASIVRQEEQWLKAERQAIQADRAAMKAELESQREKLKDERAAMDEELKSKTAKLEAELKSKTARLKKERSAFEAEKQAAASKATKSKVKLDIGGTVYHASRTTLTSMPGSMLEAMFSGRHALEEDEDGRVFIDRDGSTFKFVLEYLRSPMSFSLDGLSKREITSCEAEFDYYGLPSPVPSPVSLSPPLCLRVNTQPDGWISAQLDGDQKCCTISKANDVWAWEWVVGAEVLADHAVWKVRVNQCSHKLVVGVVANPTPLSDSHTTDATATGWCKPPDTLCVQGEGEYSPGWPGWQKSDEAIFGLNTLARTLTVYHKRTGERYTISDIPAGRAGQWRLYIEALGPTTVVLSRPTDDEHALVH